MFFDRKLIFRKLRNITLEHFKPKQRNKPLHIRDKY